MSISRAISYILLLSILAGAGSVFLSPVIVRAQSPEESATQTTQAVAQAQLDQEEAAKKKRAEEDAKKGGCGFWFTPMGDLIKCGTAFLANTALSFASYFLWVGSAFLNMAMSLTLNLSAYAKNIDAAWRLLRDLINVAFIFGILWMAIQLILGREKAWRQQLTAIILAAIFINFSLFFTKVIIDASNIVALQFYSSITGGNFTPITSAGGVISGSADSGISDQFLSRLKLTTIYNPEGVSITFANIAIIGFFGALFMLIAAAVFFLAGLMLVARSAILLLLMATSPIGYVGTWLPRLQEYHKMWWDQLISQSLFAPVFLLLVWTTLKITENQAFSTADIFTNQGSGNFATALAGKADAMGVIFNFLILIGLILAALMAAKKFSGAAGMNFATWSQKAMGSVAGGVGGFALRNSAGRLASKLATSERLKNWDAKNSGFVGRALYSGVQNMAKASYDVRGASVPGVGAVLGMGGGKIDLGTPGGKGGYQAKLDQQVEEREKYIQSRDPDKKKLAELDGAIAFEQQQMADHVKKGGKPDDATGKLIDQRIKDYKKSRREKETERKGWAADEIDSKGPSTLWQKVARKNKLGSARYRIAEFKKRIENTEKEITEHKDSIRRLESRKRSNNPNNPFTAAEQQELTEQYGKRTQKEADVATLKQKISALEADRT